MKGIFTFPGRPLSGSAPLTDRPAAGGAPWPHCAGSVLELSEQPPRPPRAPPGEQCAFSSLPNLPTRDRSRPCPAARGLRRWDTAHAPAPYLGVPASVGGGEGKAVFASTQKCLPFQKLRPWAQIHPAATVHRKGTLDSAPTRCPELDISPLP